MKTNRVGYRNKQLTKLISVNTALIAVNLKNEISRKINIEFVVLKST